MLLQLASQRRGTPGRQAKNQTSRHLELTTIVTIVP